MCHEQRHLELAPHQHRSGRLKANPGFSTGVGPALVWSKSTLLEHREPSTGTLEWHHVHSQTGSGPDSGKSELIGSPTPNLLPHAAIHVFLLCIL